MEDVADQITKHQKAIASLEGLRGTGVFSDEELAQRIAEQKALLFDLQEPKVSISTNGGAAFEKEITVNPGGTLVGRDQNNYYGNPPRDEIEIEETYRRVIAERCNVLSLPVTTPEGQDPRGTSRPLSLTSVYVSLNVEKSYRLWLKEKEGKAAEKETEMDGGIGAGDDRLLTALEAVLHNRHLVLLGVPGSGKTTFVNHLVYCLAKRELNGLPGWEEAERDILPVKVILRHFSRWLESSHITQPSECTLFDYIAYDLKLCKLEVAEDLLAKRIGHGKAILLLDGLDEIPTGAPRRLILDAIRVFSERYADCRFLVTCRVLSYQKDAWKLPAYDFPELTLAKFNPKQIEDFIQDWYREVAQKWEKPEADMVTLQAALQREIKRSYLKDLAPIPLLLTIMALVNTVDGALPGTKALLYKRCVEILLWEWEQKRFSEVGYLPRLSELLLQAGRGQSDLLVRLAKLAYQAHANWKGKNSESLAEISATDLKLTLCELHPQESMTWAKEMLDCIRERAGLLLDQGEDTFTFPHRSFQEYLAGVHLARQRSFVGESLKLLEQGDYWRETVLYAVGCLVYNNQQYEPPAYLVEKLCPERGEDTERTWQNAWMAGRVVLEMGANRLQDETDGKNLLTRLRRRLADLLEHGALTAVERAAAGDVLSALGDPRFDAACFHLPLTYQAKAEPFFGLVEIPSGKFTMGSRKGDKEAYDDEYGNPEKLTMPYRYWMGRYPVSVVQYAHFIDEGGYEGDAWWSETALLWKKGEWDSQQDNEDIKRWLARRPRELRRQPMGWEEQKVYASRPLMGITWFEARAYCKWLDSRLRQQLAEHKRPLLPDGYEIRLPSEAEWEKAARHADDRRYPWGDADCDDTRANYADSQIGSASTVGMFPRGSTPDGLHDLSGNVWEWTLSSYRKYPYQPHGDGAGDEAALRVVRGGSWDVGSRVVRCAIRRRGGPVSYLDVIGFRYVLSLASSVF